MERGRMQGHRQGWQILVLTRGVWSVGDFYPTEKPCWKVCSQFSTEASVLSFWGCHSDAPGARDTPT